MPEEISDLMKETLASPLGDVIASVGEGVAAAQRALDEGSLAMTLALYSEDGDELMRVLREVGYRPTFYALPETTGEVHVSLRLSGRVDGSAPAKPATPAPGSPAPAARAIGANLPRTLSARAYATPVDAGFANRYGYSASASAKLTFKIVPVPPPAGMEDVRAVPDLAGRTVEVVRGVLEALELNARFLDPGGQVVAAPTAAALVRGTTPAPGAVVRTGAAIDVTLEPTP